MNLKFSDRIRSKLSTRHGVSEDEILQCFANREGLALKDTREKHKTDPESQWFVAETDAGRLLKVVFMFHSSNKCIEIKTAYNANQDEIRIYDKFAKN